MALTEGRSAPTSPRRRRPPTRPSSSTGSSLPSTTVTPTVYHRNLPGGAERAAIPAAASGATSFTDEAAALGATYEYRLGVVVDGAERFWKGFGRHARGPRRRPRSPSPACSRTPWTGPRRPRSGRPIAFGARDRANELMDISGRLVRTYEVGLARSGRPRVRPPAGAASVPASTCCARVGFRRNVPEDQHPEVIA